VNGFDGEMQYRLDTNIKLGVRLAIVLIVVWIELGELALWALALTKMRRGMKHEVDVGDVPSSLAASLKAAEAVERFIFDEFYGGDAFIFAMAMHAKSRDFDG
jgi:hypothetical protein